MAPWVLLVVISCDNLFPEFEIPTASGIRWPVYQGGPCEGGIIQLAMPTLKAMPEAKKQLPYMAPRKLQKARHWQTISFMGNGITDFIALDNTRQCLQSLGDNSWREAGVRIRFGPETSYACFMEVLNTLSIWGDHKWYWLDVRHKPMTIHVILRPPEITSNQ